MNHKGFFLSIAFGALLCAAPGFPAQAAWPDHVATAQGYVNTIKAENNDYGSPASIWTVGTDLHALSRCGSFTALLLKNTYPGVITDAVLIALTGSSSPDSEEWATAISSQKADPVSGIAFTKRASVADIQPGDILASVYATSDSTGHTMTVGSVTLTNTAMAPPHAMPGVTAVNKYRVKVFDSTRTPHGSYATNPYPDSRYLKQPSGTTFIDDQGIGSGTIVLYESSSTGAIVAWASNVSTTTTAFYYNTAPAGDTAYEVRPLVAGYLSGPGL